MVHYGSVDGAVHVGRLGIPVGEAERPLIACADNSFSLGMIALNVAAPDPSVLGRLNGIYSSISALARAMGPVTIG